MTAGRGKPARAARTTDDVQLYVYGAMEVKNTVLLKATELPTVTRVPHAGDVMPNWSKDDKGTTTRKQQSKQRLVETKTATNTKKLMERCKYAVRPTCKFTVPEMEDVTVGKF